MVTIDQITVSSYDLTSLLVSWEFYETWESLDPYVLSIYRGKTPQWSESEFELIASGIDAGSVTSYEDTTVSGYLTYKWNDFYYTVVPIKEVTGEVGEVPLPKRFEYAIDLQAKEILRRKNIALRSRYGGKPVQILKRKKSGSHCPACWNETLQRRTAERCITCYDTGWTGGYWSPITVQASIGAAPKRTLIELFGEWEPQDTFLRLGAYPIIAPQDVVVDEQNRRWRVIDISPLEKGQYILTQQCRLTRLNATDVIYEYVIS